MPRAKYQSIYRDMKQRIEAGERQAQDLLPSENTLVGFYGCSRNTVRRAIAALAEDGYVQSLHGVGVCTESVSGSSIDRSPRLLSQWEELSRSESQRSGTTRCRELRSSIYSQ